MNQVKDKVESKMADLTASANKAVTMLSNSKQALKDNETKLLQAREKVNAANMMMQDESLKVA